MAALEGLRVLVVEDEVMVSLELQDILLELGCGIAGAAGRLREARALGYRLGILHSSPEGDGVYRRLGFQEYCKSSIYIWAAGSVSQI